MLGQPTETNDDVDGIMDLCEKRLLKFIMKQFERTKKR